MRKNETKKDVKKGPEKILNGKFWVDRRAVRNLTDARAAGDFKTVISG